MSTARATLALVALTLLPHPALGQAMPRELRGELFSIEQGEHNHALLAGVQVSIREVGNADVTNDQGLFRIQLPAGVSPGQEFTLRHDKKGYVICSPLYGKQIVPAEGKLVEVRMLPEGSKLFWSHERIESFLEHAADESARQPKGPEARETDLSSFIIELGKHYGFTSEEVRSEIAKWMEHASKDKADFRKQGMVAFARENFRLAGENFRRSAEEKQAQAAAALRESARDRELSGDSFSNAFDFQAALKEYQIALATLKAYRDSLGASGAAVYPEYAADVRNLVFKEARAKSDLGERIAGPDSRRNLEEAIEGYRKLIAELPKAFNPEGWAATQNSLGIALRRLGERESGAEGARHLAEAADACRQALQVRTREHLPQGWAMTENTLGNVLSSLGEREPGAEGARHLAEAADAYRQALQVYTREHLPRDWAKTQNNLAGALSSLGMREPGMEGARHLAEAADACRLALEVYTREHLPQDWAATQNNLGAALSSLGERESGAERSRHLAEAVDAFRSALQVFTREHLPQDWAATQNNLGTALGSLGVREPGMPRGCAHLRRGGRTPTSCRASRSTPASTSRSSGP